MNSSERLKLTFITFENQKAAGDGFQSIGSVDLEETEAKAGRNWAMLLVFAFVPLMSIAVIVLLVMWLTSEAFASERVPHLKMQIYCLQNRSECPLQGPKRVTYSDDLMQKMSSVHRAVNKAIKPRNEKIDTWTVESAYGDCEDYALTKRHRLIRMGVPATAMWISTFVRSNGQGHAVLIVRTTAGNYVLDNLKSKVSKSGAVGT